MKHVFPSENLSAKKEEEENKQKQNHGACAERFRDEVCWEGTSSERQNWERAVASAASELAARNGDTLSMWDTDALFPASAARAQCLASPAAETGIRTCTLASMLLGIDCIELCSFARFVRPRQFCLGRQQICSLGRNGLEESDLVGSESFKTDVFTARQGWWTGRGWACGNSACQLGLCFFPPFVAGRDTKRKATLLGEYFYSATPAHPHTHINVCLPLRPIALNFRMLQAH